MRKFSWLWIPRGVMFFYIIFLLMFSFDAFNTIEPFFDQLLAFFIHSIPSWVFIIVMIVTWKKPLVAGITFIVIGILGMIFLGTYEHLTGFMLLTVPPILIGLAYIIYDKMIKESE